MSHLIKLSKHFGGAPVHRVYEQKVSTKAEIRELIGNLQALVNGANREGRELVVEIWTEHRGESIYETSTPGASKGFQLLSDTIAKIMTQKGGDQKSSRG